MKAQFWIITNSLKKTQEVDSTHSASNDGDVSICDAEILDELTTSRGELKLRNLSFKEDRRTQQVYHGELVTISSIPESNNIPTERHN
ncbi:hypothetical protein QVD17_10994 [Tagetes erecta]|uniref:Uncharacterized protein n=1 Tax=Tagetes erecta TaxID=13708 RepID=A0AAD8L7M2_TARER|nr:hypothetical protein QVD17_10994 [Tagetes erecta]